MRHIPGVGLWSGLVHIPVLIFAGPTIAQAQAPESPKTVALAKAPASTMGGDGLTTAARIFRDRMSTFVRENARIDAEDGTTNTGYIVLLGDSITQGFPQKKFFPDLPMVNRGIANDQVGDASRPSGRGVINRLHESVWQCRPIHVFVLIGVNDIGSGIKGDRLEKRHEDLLKALMEGMPATSITLQTILPTRGRFAKLNEAIIDANRRLNRLAGERGIHVLDLHATMANEQGQLREEYTNDGLHLNGRGNEVWSHVLREELQRLGYFSK